MIGFYVSSDVKQRVAIPNQNQRLDIDTFRTALDAIRNPSLTDVVSSLTYTAIAEVVNK